MKTVQQHAKEIALEIAKGETPLNAYFEHFDPDALSGEQRVELRMAIAQEQLKLLRDLRFCAEILFKHIEKLDGGKCIEKSAPMFKAMIGIES